jgi:DnaJ family protein C protein 11
VFEFPVSLSRDVRDWQLLAGAMLLPPLASLFLSRCVVRPALRWHRRRQEAGARAESRQQVQGQLHKARGETLLLEPVARRKARAEANRDGLVILEAVYGTLEAYLADPAGAAAAAAAAAVAAGADAAGADAAGVNGAAGGSQPAAEAAAEAGRQEAEVPSFIDVTFALQYLVHNGALQLHGDVPKLGLMGFADPAPGECRQLHVVFCHGKKVFEVTVGDEQRLVLPGAGQEVREAAKLHGVLARGSARLGLQLHSRNGRVVLAAGAAAGGEEPAGKQ